MISWFGITIIENKNLHQWVMYSYELVESNTTWYLLPGKKSTIIYSNKVQGISFIRKI